MAAALAGSLDGFEHDETGWNGSGAHLFPVRTITLHTTEGDDVEGARRWLNHIGAQPTVLAEGRARKGRRRVQMVSTARAAKALKNLPGGTQTNKGGTLQVELNGFAANPASYTEGDWLWIGEAVVGPLCDEYAIPPTAPFVFYSYPPPNGWRLGREPYRVLDDGDDVRGVVGHQHWTENAHGDPGDLSAKLYRNGTASALDLILEGARRFLHIAPTNTNTEALVVTDADKLIIADIVGKVLDRRLNPDGKGNLLVRVRDTVARMDARSVETVRGVRATVEGVRAILAADADEARDLGADQHAELANVLRLVPKVDAPTAGDNVPGLGIDLGPATAEAV